MAEYLLLVASLNIFGVNVTVFDVSLNTSNLKMSISALIFKFDMISFDYVLIIKTRY